MSGAFHAMVGRLDVCVDEAKVMWSKNRAKTVKILRGNLIKAHQRGPGYVRIQCQKYEGFDGPLLRAHNARRCAGVAVIFVVVKRSKNESRDPPNAISDWSREEHIVSAFYR